MGPKWPHCDRESSSRSAATRTCVSLTCGLTASSGTPATLLSSYYFSAALRREQAPPRWFPRCGPTWPHGDRESSARSAATRTCVSLTCGFTASSSTPANLLSSYDFSASLGRELLHPGKTCRVAETALRYITLSYSDCVILRQGEWSSQLGEHGRSGKFSKNRSRVELRARVIRGWPHFCHNFRVH